MIALARKAGFAVKANYAVRGALLLEKSLDAASAAPACKDAHVATLAA